MLQRVLLESEAAALLRRSPSCVKRMRLERRLSYYKGKPPTISEEDLQIFVAQTKVRRKRRDKGDQRNGVNPPGQSANFYYLPENAAASPFKLLTIAEAADKFERKPRAIRYLCLAGHVPYILGRPPLIDEKDIAEYFERRRQTRDAAATRFPDTPEGRGQALRQMRLKIRRKRLRQTLKPLLQKIAMQIAAGTHTPGRKR